MSHDFFSSNQQKVDVISKISQGWGKDFSSEWPKILLKDFLRLTQKNWICKKCLIFSLRNINSGHNLVQKQLQLKGSKN